MGAAGGCPLRPSSVRGCFGDACGRAPEWAAHHLLDGRLHGRLQTGQFGDRPLALVVQVGDLGDRLLTIALDALEVSLPPPLRLVAYVQRPPRCLIDDFGSLAAGDFSKLLHLDLCLHA